MQSTLFWQDSDSDSAPPATDDRRWNDTRRRHCCNVCYVNSRAFTNAGVVIKPPSHCRDRTRINTGVTRTVYIPLISFSLKMANGLTLAYIA